MAGTSQTGPQGPAGSSPALADVRELLLPQLRPRQRSGYLDLLGQGGVRRSFAQGLMQSRLLPHVYERFWRPMWFGAVTLGISEQEEAELMLGLLDLRPGDRVLDVACGPGNTLRRLLHGIGAGGLAVGVDAAAGMLERAVDDTPAPNAAYVRADGADLPFVDQAFDAVSCFGALYLVDRPFDVVDELARVTAPGGRIAILTTVDRGPVESRPLRRAARLATGVRWFGRGEITSRLEAAGLVDVTIELRGLMQYVGARRPAA